MVKVLKAVANGLRFEMIRLLRESAMSVSELSHRLERERSTISHHLRVLRGQDLVRSKKDGRNTIYRPKRTDLIDKIFELRPILRRDE